MGDGLCFDNCGGDDGPLHLSRPSCLIKGVIHHRLLELGYYSVPHHGWVGYLIVIEGERVND